METDIFVQKLFFQYPGWFEILCCCTKQFGMSYDCKFILISLINNFYCEHLSCLVILNGFRRNAMKGKNPEPEIIGAVYLEFPSRSSNILNEYGRDIYLIANAICL